MHPLLCLATCRRENSLSRLGLKLLTVSYSSSYPSPGFLLLLLIFERLFLVLLLLFIHFGWELEPGFLILDHVVNISVHGGLHEFVKPNLLPVVSVVTVICDYELVADAFGAVSG